MNWKRVLFLLWILNFGGKKNCLSNLFFGLTLKTIRPQTKTTPNLYGHECIDKKFLAAYLSICVRSPIFWWIIMNKLYSNDWQSLKILLSRIIYSTTDQIFFVALLLQSLCYSDLLLNKKMETKNGDVRELVRDVFNAEQIFPHTSFSILISQLQIEWQTLWNDQWFRRFWR